MYIQGNKLPNGMYLTALQVKVACLIRADNPVILGCFRTAEYTGVWDRKAGTLGQSPRFCMAKVAWEQLHLGCIQIWNKSQEERIPLGNARCSGAFSKLISQDTHLILAPHRWYKHCLQGWEREKNGIAAESKRRAPILEWLSRFAKTTRFVTVLAV